MSDAQNISWVGADGKFYGTDLAIQRVYFDGQEIIIEPIRPEDFYVQPSDA